MPVLMVDQVGTFPSQESCSSESSLVWAHCAAI